MMKRLMVGLIASGLLAATASPALAGPILLMGCSDGFQLLDEWPEGNYPDRNENEQVCIKVTQGGPPPGGMPPLIKPIVLTDDHPIGPPLG